MLHHTTQFQTAMGLCRIEWNAEGVTRIVLESLRCHPSTGLDPGEGSRDAKEQILRLRLRMTKHLNGTPQSFADVPLCWNGIPPFHRRVYQALQKIPAGQTVTYAELAARVGSPKAARAVGQAMAKNPFLIIVPCHRVLAAGGRLGGFSGGNGAATKLALLSSEGYTAVALTSRHNSDSFAHT